MPDFTDSDIPCNCPWLGCRIHPDGLCNRTAAKMDCGNPDHLHHVHYLGEGSLGEDVHICTDCAGVLMCTFLDDIVDLMQDLTEHVPQWMTPLESMCRETYKARINSGGWEKPQRDAAAILALAYAVVCFDDYHKKEIPPPLIARLTALKKTVSSIASAYKLSEKGVGVHE